MKNSDFTFHSNFTKFNELVFNCVNLMPFLTRQPIFTLWKVKSTIESSNSDEFL